MNKYSITELEAKEFWTLDEAAYYLGIEPQTLRVANSKNELPYYKKKASKTSKVHYKQKDVKEWAYAVRIPSKLES